jgi:uncharacterized protein YjbI with pentapeptide repeats
MTQRAYNTLFTGANLGSGQISQLTGANLQNIVLLGVNLGVFTINTTLLSEAYAK